MAPLFLGVKDTLTIKGMLGVNRETLVATIAMPGPLRHFTSMRKRNGINARRSEMNPFFRTQKQESGCFVLAILISRMAVDLT